MSKLTNLFIIQNIYTLKQIAYLWLIAATNNNNNNNNVKSTHD